MHRRRVNDQSTNRFGRMNRRDLLQLMGAWSAAMALRPLLPRVANQRAVTLRLVVLSPREQTPALTNRDLGITLGIDEAKHAATMFGGTVEATTATADSSAHVSRAVSDAAGSTPISALLGGEDIESCLALASLATARHCVHVNVTCTSDALRNGECRRRSFHVAPSDAMLRDAVTGVTRDETNVTAWHPALERYGADTLNRRFEARFNRPMTAEAWCGWIAVKVLWESTLRARSTDAGTIIRYLESERASFDGHKGRPLGFRPWDHQLRQPVYVERGGAPIIEMPASTTADEPSREVLDRIGTPAARSVCRWTSE
jgi:ABC-type branched-subunit amino acid transport system substrate-binding protein